MLFQIYIYNGKVHIIPKEESVSCISEGLQCVRNKPDKTQASQGVQALIDKRLAG